LEQSTTTAQTPTTSSSASSAGAPASASASQLRGKTLAEQDAALDPAQQPGFDAQEAKLAPGGATTQPAPATDALTAKQLSKAKGSYTRGAAQWPPERIKMVGQAVGLTGATVIDDAFVQAVARWQKSQGIGVDGILGPDGLKHMFGDLASDDAHARASAVTKKFESGDLGYAAYQNVDKGIVSYGVHQCTLAAGSLAKVIDAYLAKAAAKDPMSANAKGLQGYKAKYASSNLEVKEGLRGDGTFKQYLIDAAAEPEMVAAQEQVFESEYWKPAVGIAVSCGITTSLGLAAVYDCAIQSGPGGAKAIADKAIAALGGIVGSTGTKGVISETDFIIGFDAAREAQLDVIIAKNKAEGTDSGTKNAEMLEQSKARGRMFTSLAEQGQTGLAGDADGNLALPGQKNAVKVPTGDGGSAVMPVATGGAALTPKPSGATDAGAAASKPATGPATAGAAGAAGTQEQSWGDWAAQKAGEAWDWVTGAGGSSEQAPPDTTAKPTEQSADTTKDAAKEATKGTAVAGAQAGASSGVPLSTTPQVSGTTAKGYQSVGAFKVLADTDLRDKNGKAKGKKVMAGQIVQVVAGGASGQYAQIVSVSGATTIVEADQAWVQLKNLTVDNEAATAPGGGKTGAGVELPADLQGKLPEGRKPGTSASKMTFKAGVSFFDEDCAIAPDTMGRVMRVVQWAIGADMVNGDIVISDAARSRKRAHTYATAHNIQVGEGSTASNILARAKAVSGAENVADKDGNQWWLKDWGLDPNADEATAKAKIVERSKQIRTQSKPAAEGYRSSEFADRRWPNDPGEGISKHCSGNAVDLNIPWKIAGGGTDLWAWEDILKFFGLARTVSSESWHVEPKGTGQVGIDPGKADGEP